MNFTGDFFLEKNVPRVLSLSEIEIAVDVRQERGQILAHLLRAAESAVHRAEIVGTQQVGASKDVAFR